MIALALSIAYSSTAYAQSSEEQRLILKLNESHKVCIQENESLHMKIAAYNHILDIRQARIKNLESVVEQAGKIDAARVEEINQLSDVVSKQEKHVKLLKTSLLISVAAIPAAFIFGLTQ